MTLLVVGVILALASYRITRLVIEDEIADRPRNWLFKKIKPGSFFDTLLTCYWCLGFWVSVLVVGLYWAFPDVTPWILAPFALSALVGLIDQKAN